MDTLSEKQLYDKFGAPDPEQVSRVDGDPLPAGVPSHVYSPVWLGCASEDIIPSEAKILLTDFGVSFRPAEESRFESYTPLELRPPEARFEPTVTLSFPSDIWSLACTIWAILGQRSFLDSFLLGPDDSLGDQIDALGPLPPEWWNKWNGRSEKFTEDGHPHEGRQPWTFEQRFEDSIQAPRRDMGMATMDDEERDALFKMILWMLRYRPEERPSAEQVLNTSWMRNWGLPAYENA